LAGFLSVIWLHPVILKTSSHCMLTNYFKIAWRNLLKDRQFTVLNLLGLSVGMTCAFLIGLWVADELSVDKYNEKDAQLYQVMTNQQQDNGIKTGSYTPGILAPALAKEIPEVQYATEVLPASWFDSKGVLVSGDKKIRAQGSYVDKNYFSVFTVHFVAGDKDRLFRDQQTVAISTNIAQTLFGTTDNLIGRMVKYDAYEFSGSFTISGIFEPNPPDATEQPDLLFNYDIALKVRPNLNTWTNEMDPNTYLAVKKGADIGMLNKKIENFIKRKDEKADVKLFLAKYSDQYLYNRYENGRQAGGRITYVRIFSLIAVFILLIACINFMNLSTAKATKRAKEVGIKKVVGASRGSLVLQYLGESVLMTLIALLLSIALIGLCLPFFNQVTGKQLSIHFSAPLAGAVIGIALLTGLFAGSYPAFYLSGFRPVMILKGKVRTSFSELLARKGLVVFQFTLSVMFIAAVLIIYRQVQYIQSKDLGYRRENLIHFEIPMENDSAKVVSAISFVKELGNIPGVASAGSFSHDLTGHHGAISGFQWPGKSPNMDIEFANLEMGANFLQTVGIKIKEGRNFSDNAEAAHNEIIFNETAIQAMGLKDPIGKTVRFWDQQRKIVGIAADFNFESMYQAVKPCFFQIYPVGPQVILRLKAGSERATIAAVKEAYARFNPGQAFEYKYLDEDYQKWYASEIRTGILSRYFAGLAIFISCLGLFGLAAFMAQKRQKEIGIRKVVGASVTQVTFLLSKDFLILVGIAIVIAFPLVGWAMQNWLKGFAYRVSISADIFLVTGAAALFITILTISFQSIRAALANPADSLRTE
jgi:putative ABC transport system permease protein